MSLFAWQIGGSLSDRQGRKALRGFSAIRYPFLPHFAFINIHESRIKQRGCQSAHTYINNPTRFPTVHLFSAACACFLLLGFQLPFFVQHAKCGAPGLSLSVMSHGTAFALHLRYIPLFLLLNFPPLSFD